jgi:hypothetical protein
MSDPETIWLAPCCPECVRHVYSDTNGRTWCEDVYDPCEECGREPVKYVRTDLDRDTVLSDWDSAMSAELRVKVEQLQFTTAELNLLRQWYNALVDVMPSYLSDADHELMQKITERLK